MTSTPKPHTDPSTSQTSELSAAVERVLAALDSAQATLGIADDAVLSPDQKRRAPKMRRGGEEIVARIGDMATKHRYEAPARPVATMRALLAKADALQPLADRLATFTKLVGDGIFGAQSQAWDMAMAYYALLRRSAPSDGELEAELRSVAEFFSTRRPGVGRKGTRPDRFRLTPSEAQSRRRTSTR